MVVGVGGQLTLASGSKPLGHVVVSVCCLVGDSNADGGGIAFDGGGVEGDCTVPRFPGGLLTPVSVKIMCMSIMGRPKK